MVVHGLIGRLRHGWFAAGLCLPAWLFGALLVASGDMVSRAGGAGLIASMTYSAAIPWYRARVVGIFPNEAACDRLIGAHLLERDEQWQCERTCYLVMDHLDANTESEEA